MLTTYKSQRLCQGKEDSFQVAIEACGPLLQDWKLAAHLGGGRKCLSAAGGVEGGSQRQEAFALYPQRQHKITSFPAQSAGGRAVLALGLAAAALLLMGKDQLVKS